MARALIPSGNWVPSIGYRRSLVIHRKALSAPMVGAQMAGDPAIRLGPSLAASLRERRACQYASAMAAKLGMLPADQTAFAAVFEAATTTVHFVTRNPDGSPRLYASFSIPSRVMEFNPDAEALCLPAPDDAPCGETQAMDLGEPVDLSPGRARREAMAAIAEELALAAIEAELFGENVERFQ